MARKSKFAPCFTLALLVALIISIAAPAHAGILNGNPNAGTFPAFTGTAHFSDVLLDGDLDWAVFTAAEFATAFPSSSYAPTDAVVYTYQIDNTGTAAISAEIVGVSNPANGIGSFESVALSGEQAPSGAFLNASGANWLFASPSELDSGETSYILAFSSPNTPMAGAALTIDSGESDLVLGVPTPGPNAIPEPSTLTLLAIGFLCWFKMRR